VHELSIAYSIVSQAALAAERAGAGRVIAVRIVVGALSGVSGDALLFSYDVATEGTPLEGSRLEIRTVPVVLHCTTCDRDVELPDVQHFQCPLCGEPSADVRGGRDLDIEALEVEDAPEPGMTSEP
jgi:hydrogenase nickel incorporation protein HypA/HybF